MADDLAALLMHGYQSPALDDRDMEFDTKDISRMAAHQKAVDDRKGPQAAVNLVTTGLPLLGAAHRMVTKPGSLADGNLAARYHLRQMEKMENPWFEGVMGMAASPVMKAYLTAAAPMARRAAARWEDDLPRLKDMPYSSDFARHHMKDHAQDTATMMQYMMDRRRPETTLY